MPQVTILGGGTSAPRLCALLAAALPGPLRLVLHGRRPERLAVLARAAVARMPVDGSAWVDAEPERGRALEGADAVVTLVRIGGFAARGHDERFPRAFGLVGDEGLGVGGLANGWRTVPFMAELAAELRHRCPGAFVANLMAPLGMTTAVLLEAGLDALGVCELPFVTREGLRHAAGEGHYGGLNHLGWFWDLPRAPGVHPLKYQARVFGGALPEDRPATPGRAEVLAALDARVAAQMARTPDTVALGEADRPTPWFEHALVPLLGARLGHGTHAGFANVPNSALLPGLPADQIVEVEAEFTGARRVLRPSGPLPEAEWPLLEAVARAERLGLAGARARDPARLTQALAALPYALTRTQLEALTALAREPIGVES